MSEQKGEAQHVLVAVTGSVAAIKVPELVEQLTLQHEAKVMNQLFAKYNFIGLNYWTELLD